MKKKMIDLPCAFTQLCLVFRLLYHKLHISGPEYIWFLMAIPVRIPASQETLVLPDMKIYQYQ